MGVAGLVLLALVYGSQCSPVQNPGNANDLPDQAEHGQKVALQNLCQHYCTRLVFYSFRRQCYHIQSILRKNSYKTNIIK